MKQGTLKSYGLLLLLNKLRFYLGMRRRKKKINALPLIYLNVK